MSFGSRFKMARENLGLSQQAIADRLNVTDGTISNYEKSVAFPRWDTINKICDILNVDPNFLFWDDLPSELKAKIISEDINHNPKIETLITTYKSLNVQGQKFLSEFARLLSSDNTYSKTQAFSLPGYQSTGEIAAYDVDDTPTDDWQPPISETTAD